MIVSGLHWLRGTYDGPLFSLLFSKIRIFINAILKPKKVNKNYVTTIFKFFRNCFLFLSAIWSSHGQDGTLSPAEGLVGFKPLIRFQRLNPPGHSSVSHRKNSFWSFFLKKKWFWHMKRQVCISEWQRMNYIILIMQTQARIYLLDH